FGNGTSAQIHAFCTLPRSANHRDIVQIPLISIYLPAILSLILFPLIVPPLEILFSTVGNSGLLRWTRKVPRGELFLELVYTSN
ncbi:hypothetical protein, partial [Porphyromonas sp.]|uniref:hypothetical protein n=1 Tax=Porphyromonas sp. TaxID=1924944 RepID=UPI0025F090FB